MDHIVVETPAFNLLHIIIDTLIVLIAWALVYRAMEARRRTEEVLRQARDELEVRVIERTAELDRANKALRESEERYRTLFDNFPEPTTVWDRNGVLMMQNLVSARNLGGKREDYLGKSIFDIFGEPAEGYMERMVRVIDTGITENQEDVVDLHSGKRYFWTCMQPTQYPVGRNAVQVISYDITERKRAEKALWESERKLDRMLQTMPDGMVMVDLTGQIIYANRGAERILEIHKDEILGKYFSSREWRQIDEHGQPFPPDQLPLAVALREQREVGLIEHPIIAPDGEIKWLSVNAAPLFDEAGQLYGAVAGFRDITGRKQDEAALRKERDRAQSYLNIAGAIIVAIDASQKVTLINARGCQILGYPENEIVGANWFDTFTPERARHEVKAAFAQLLAGNLEPTEYFENPILTRDGEECLIAWHNAILRDETGRIVGTLSSGEDITERRRAAQELSASEEKFATVFRFSPDAIGIIRVADDAFLDVNEAFTTLLGYPRSDVIGRSWLEMNLAPTTDEQNQLAGLFQEKGKVADFECNITTRGGTLAVVLLSLIPITISGEPCVLAIAHDITKRKQSEEALRRVQAELAQGIQERIALEERQRLARELHDSVSQALYGISLGAHTALSLFDEDRTKVLEAINYILSLAQAGLTEMRALIFELRPESLAMEGLVTALTKQTAALRARYNIEVEVSLCDEPEVPLSVKTALYRIAQEALHNAVKHARPNRLAMRLACEPDSLKLEVRDNGIGFDPQADYPGHLGLRSMRERAQSVGGMLDIASAPDSGTRIFVCVPIIAS